MKFQNLRLIFILFFIFLLLNYYFFIYVIYFLLFYFFLFFFFFSPGFKHYCFQPAGPSFYYWFKVDDGQTLSSAFSFSLLLVPFGPFQGFTYLSRFFHSSNSCVL